MRSLQPIVILVLIILLTSCGKDQDIITEEVITDERIKKIKLRGKVERTKVDIFSNGAGTIKEIGVDKAQVTAYRGVEMLARTYTEPDGAYFLEIGYDLEDSLDYTLTVKKAGLTTIMQPIDGEKEYLDHNVRLLEDAHQDTTDQEPVSIPDGYAWVTLEIDTDEDYVFWMTQEVDGGTLIQGKCIVRGRESFQIAVKLNTPITEYWITNVLGCPSDIPSNAIPLEYSEETDLGLVTGITIEPLKSIGYNTVSNPSCINGDVINIEKKGVPINELSSLKVCESVNEITTTAIDYKNQVRTEVKTISVGSGSESISFSECIDYPTYFYLINANEDTLSVENGRVEIITNRFFSLERIINEQGETDIKDAYYLTARIDGLYEMKISGQIVGPDPSGNRIWIIPTLFQDADGEYIFTTPGTYAETNRPDFDERLVFRHIFRTKNGEEPFGPGPYRLVTSAPYLP